MITSKYGIKEPFWQYQRVLFLSHKRDRRKGAGDFEKI